MKYLNRILAVLAISISLSILGCSSNSESNSTRALFDTKAEAEKAAKNFNCTGAHQMDNKWMPCESHGAHEERKKHSEHHH